MKREVLQLKDRDINGLEGIHTKNAQSGLDPNKYTAVGALGKELTRQN